ncbi:MAG TPA: ABC transporter permease [Bryobacteraceae bacterium]|nr:ABC transporter permease [Bryobacteraceae bacterium]
MKNLWQDVAFGLRMLLKRPGLTAAAVVSLALGIGANTAIFGLINTILLGPLPYHDLDRVVMVATVPPQHPRDTRGASVPEYFAWQKQNRAFETLGAASQDERDFGTQQNGVAAERIRGEEVTPEVFAALGVQPILGRVFTAAEDPIDAPAPVMVISHRLWQRRFASDPNVLSKAVLLDGVNTSIIGVMPPEFRFEDDVSDFWSPIRFNHFQLSGSARYLVVVARLKPGVGIRQAQSEMDAVAAQLAKDFPDRNKGWGIRVQTVREGLFGEMRQPLLVLEGAVAFVLLIACANVAGLLLARASSRRTEVAVRMALGAGRGHIVRQLLTESMLLSLLGGALGVLLAWWGLRALVSLSPPYFPRLHEIGVDLRVLGFTALVSILTGIAFGFAPALMTSKPDLVESLKESARGASASRGRQRLRGALVASQIALSLVLLVGAGLLINSFVRLQRTAMGCDPTGLLTFQLRLPLPQYSKPVGTYHGFPLLDISPEPALLFDRVYQRIRAVPGAQSAAGSAYVPLTEGPPGLTFQIEGQPVPDRGSERDAYSATLIPVTPNFFATMKIPLLRGRDFTARDTASSPWVTVINETMARRFWPNEDPIGKRLTLDLVPDERPREVIAVVRDTSRHWQTKPEAMMYVPHVQQPMRYRGPYQFSRVQMTFVIRTAGNPMRLSSAMQKAVAEVNPNVSVSEVHTVEQYLADELQEPRYYMLLLGVFSVVATALAAIGIYGVIAFSVAQRTREIGLRMALGASRPDVLKLMARQAAPLILGGLTLGLLVSLAVTHVLSAQLWGVTATDPQTFVAVAALLALISLLACFVPARRAIKVDPSIALRYE